MITPQDNGNIMASLITTIASWKVCTSITDGHTEELMIEQDQ